MKQVPGIDGSFDLRHGRIVFIPFGQPDPPMSVTSMFCKGCQKDLPLADFYYDSKGGRYKFPCIKCQMEYQRKYRELNKPETKGFSDLTSETVGSPCWRNR